MYQKIILIGYMGAGKSTVGKVLARQLNMLFMDLDDYIETQEQDSIPNIFKLKGEDYFRKTEFKYLQEILLKQNNFVLSLGGGTPTTTEAIALIKASSFSFYLKNTVEQLSKRLKPKQIERPLLDNISETLVDTYITNHLKIREAHYSQANVTIQTANLSIEQIVSKMVDIILK